jgi:hypothetical protein
MKDHGQVTVTSTVMKDYERIAENDHGRVTATYIKRRINCMGNQYGTTFTSIIGQV